MASATTESTARGKGWIAELSPQGPLWRYRFRALCSMRWEEGYEHTRATAEAAVVSRLGEAHLLGVDEMVIWEDTA